MARIRSLKPEFWDSEDTGTLSPLAALTYAGLWNLADDEGRGRFGAVLIHGRLHAVRPGVTPQKTKAALDELLKRKLLAIYKDADGTPFFYIPTFKRHQKPQKPLPSKLPPPPVELQEKYGNATVAVQESYGLVGEEEGRGRVDGGEGESPPPSPAAPYLPLEVTQIVQAYRSVDTSVPEENCIKHVESALKRGAPARALFDRVHELAAKMKIWAICDLVLEKPKNGAHEFKPSKTICPNCGGTGQVAGGVVDGKITLVPCRRCQTLQTSAGTR